MDAQKPVLPPHRPRKIDPARTFESIVDWIAEKSEKEHATGLIVGVSGTDSILTFLVCAKAFERLGRPERVLGLHFQHQARTTDPHAMTCVSPAFNWVASDILPWLKMQAPRAQIEIDTSLPQGDDNKRWGHIFSRAVAETSARQGMHTNHYFPVGTRNRTEERLGAYSQISKNVSMLPLIQLYKSEVLEICRHLGVPRIAIDKSGEVDCECGRFETQAHYLRELDLYLMAKDGLLSKDYLHQSIPRDILNAVAEFYAEENHANAFRGKTPYRPERDLVVA